MGRTYEAAEMVGDPRGSGALVVTCDHATAIVPAPLPVLPDDRPWLKTHHAYDVGAAAVARELVRVSGSVGVLSRYSRLICDPNRAPEHPQWILEQVEGYRLGFNRQLSPEERRRRQTYYHEPYHALIDRVLAERVAGGGDVLLLAIHSCAPEVDGTRRPMELGVLFDHYEPVARRVAALTTGAGLATALNEPYSGRQGMIYATQLHGRARGVIHIALELRHDLIATESKAAAMGRRLAQVLAQLRLRSKRRDG